MSTKNTSNYLKKRNEFRDLLARVGQGQPVTKHELNVAHFSLKRLAKKFTGSNEFTPAVNKDAERYITNKRFFNLYARNKTHPILAKYARNFYKTTNIKGVRNFIAKKMAPQATEAIKRVRRRLKPTTPTPKNNKNNHVTKNAQVRRNFIVALHRNSFNNHYVNTLGKLNNLDKHETVFGMIRANVDPHTAITSAIGPCHYRQNFKSRPKVQNMPNIPTIRSRLGALNRPTTREYINILLDQFSYVAREYAKMSDVRKKEYREQLKDELSGRPCLENLLDSMAKCLFKQEFVLLGKIQNPYTGTNNIRYVGTGPELGKSKGLMNQIIRTWNKNFPNGWNNKNDENKINMFWNMIKNNEIYAIHQGVPMNMKLSQFNKNGKVFKSSILAQHSIPHFPQKRPNKEPRT